MALIELLDSGLDSLYCEESIENDEIIESCMHKRNDGLSYNNVVKDAANSFSLIDEDDYWDDDELESLLAQEKETHPRFHRKIVDAYLLETRSEAVKWILSVKTYYGFTAQTAVLAVNYLDRFMASTMFQRDKPWMGQLTAVACLSIAAKVEETYVPLLLELQVEESKFVFESKTIKRMELLLLSTLQWRMHPVIPLSFIDHISRRFCFKKNIHREFVKKSELLLMSIIADHGICSFQPSVIATVTMLRVIGDLQPWTQLDYHHQLVTLLRVNEVEVNKCFKQIDDGSTDCHLKRKSSYPLSPNGVMDAIYSSDSSNDSWSVTSSVSLSSTASFKRRRPQNEPMPFSSKRIFVNVFNSPY